MDYDDYDDQNNPTFRWVSVIVLLMAVTGFMSLAWYAYQTGTDHATQESGDVIEAETTPIKEKPVDAGGVQFPHQEKTIYNVIDKNAQDSAVTVMKASEEPIKTSDDDVENIEEKITKDEDAADDEVKAEEKPVEKVEGLVPAKGSQSADKKIAEILKKAVDESKESLKSGKPSTAAASEDALKKVPDPFAALEKKEAVKKEPEPAKPAAAMATSSAQVQLGAFQSEAEARMNWDKMKSKNADLLKGLESQIVRADLGEKGVFYRLRAKGFASSAKAAETCKTLASRSLGCFVVQ